MTNISNPGLSLIIFIFIFIFLPFHFTSLSYHSLHIISSFHFLLIPSHSTITTTPINTSHPTITHPTLTSSSSSSSSSSSFSFKSKSFSSSLFPYYSILSNNLHPQKTHKPPLLFNYILTTQHLFFVTVSYLHM